RDLDRVLGGPDFRIRRIEVFQHRVQGGGLARAGRPADEEQTIGLAYYDFQRLQVVRREAEFFQRNRLARGENTHDDVLDSALSRDSGDPQLDVQRTELLELDLAVLRPALLRDVQVAHDLDAGDDGVAVGSRHFDVGRERTVLPEPDLGLALARIGLDVDVGGPLIIGIDDDLVYELHQLVVGCLGEVVPGALARGLFVVFKPREHFADIAGVDYLGAVEDIERFLELALRGDPVDELALGKHVLHNARALNPLRIEAQHDHAFLAVVDRHPLVLLDVLPLQVFQQLHGLDAVGFERFIGHAEEFRQRLADGRQLYLELLYQHLLDVHRLLARRARGQLELRRRYHRVAHQEVVLGLDYLGFLPLPESDRQRLRQLGHALFHQRRKRHAGLVVDDLDDADQLFAFHYRRHQHLFGAVAGALVHFLQKTQVGVDRLQLAFIVDIPDVNHLLGEGDIAADRVLGDRQLQVLEGIQSGLDLGHDGLLVLANDVNGEAIGIEQAADIGRNLEHDLVDVGSGMDLVGDVLQILREHQPGVDVGRSRCRGRWGIQNCTHSDLVNRSAQPAAAATTTYCILYDKKKPSALRCSTGYPSTRTPGRPARAA